jgi:hypothetical protein
MAKTKVREVLQSDDSTKEKLSYLWGYYRWHTILSILGILLIGYSVYEFMNRPNITFHITVLREDLVLDEEGLLNQEIDELMELEEGETYVSFTPSQEITAERFIAQWTAQEYDLILLDEEQYELYVGEGTMHELQLVSGVDEEDLITHEVYTSPVAIDADAIPLFASYDTTSDSYVMIPANTQNLENVFEFFRKQGIELEVVSE